MKTKISNIVNSFLEHFSHVFGVNQSPHHGMHFVPWNGCPKLLSITRVEVCIIVHWSRYYYYEVNVIEKLNRSSPGN